MTAHRAVTLRRVTLGQTRILRNLFSYFIHDLAAYERARIDRNGFYNNPGVGHVIAARGHHSFFIMHGREIAGFVSLTRPPYHSKDRKTTVVQHFFVLNGYRRQRVGSRAVRLFLRRFPGTYALGQLAGNKPATRFWRTVLRRMRVRYRESMMRDSGQTLLVQRFTWPRRPGRSSP